MITIKKNGKVISELDERIFETYFKKVDDENLRFDLYKQTNDIEDYSFSVNCDVGDIVKFIINDQIEKNIEIKNIGYSNILKPVFGSHVNGGKELNTHCFIIGRVIK